MRNLLRSKSVFVICGLALVLGFGLIAAAQDAAPTPQPQAAPPTQPTPAPGAEQRDTPPPQAQSQQPSVDDELQLTPDQKEKIAAIVDDENKELAVVRGDTSMTLEQKQAKAQQIRQTGVPKIKAVLTPEQLQKLAAIQERNRQQQSSPQQQSNPQSAPQAPPQR